jgi:acetylglutamate kinase
VDGRLVDLDRVGIPDAASDTRLLRALVAEGFVPVVACIGAGRDGQLFNVNADTLAGHLAARLGAERLAIAGTTAGVLEADGTTASLIDDAGIERLVTDGTATAGMIAKLRACQQAIRGGVDDVLIIDGRDGRALEAAGSGRVPDGATRIRGGH